MSPLNSTEWKFNPDYEESPYVYNDSRFNYNESDILYVAGDIDPEFNAVKPTNWAEPSAG